MSAKHDELRRKAAAATPGRWHSSWGAHGQGGGDHAICLPANSLQAVALNLSMQDANYIAAASPDVVLALLDEIRELQAELGRCKLLAKYADYQPIPPGRMQRIKETAPSLSNPDPD